MDTKEIEKMHKSALTLVRDQIKKHSLGKLVFLAFIGTRPWGIARKNVDYDYRGIYASKEDNTYQAFVSGVYINNCAKDITLISLERFIQNILNSNIHSLIVINSPIIYASKDFLEFRRWVNSHLSKEIYNSCQTKVTHSDRKDYLYDFFFIGNGISVLKYKKIVADLSKLNKKYLKIKAMDRIIEEEKQGLPFTAKSKQACKKILRQLKIQLEKAYRQSSLPDNIKTKKFFDLKILKKVNAKYWHPAEISLRYQKERKKYGVT